MVGIILSLLSICLILLIDRRKLKKYHKDNKREVWVYFCLLGVSTALLLLHSSGKSIPTPLTWISALLKPLVPYF